MVFQFLPPSPRLAGVVRQHQIIRLRFAPGEAVPPKAYWPRPAAALAFYPRDREWVRGLEDADPSVKPRAALIGQPTALSWRQGGRDFCVYQIELEPGALYRLTGLSLADLTNQTLDAEAVFPAGFRRLVDRIEDAEDPHAMIGLAEGYLAERLERSNRTPALVDHLAGRLIAAPNLSVERLAARHDLSARHLRRDFARRVGVSPKLFGRIARFDRLMRLHNRAPETDWLSLAIDVGYYDDHHLRRDFALFAGTTPSAFSLAEAKAPERAFGFREI